MSVSPPLSHCEVRFRIRQLEGPSEKQFLLKMDGRARSNQNEKPSFEDLSSDACKANEL